MRIGTLKESYVADAALFDSRTQHAWLAVAAVLLLVFPFVASDYWLYMACLVAINVASATGLNILTGYTGLVSLGKRPLWAWGPTRWPFCKRATARRFIQPAGRGAWRPCWAAWSVGIPSLRVKGLYLAIVTIAASFIAHFLFANFDFTGGTAGISMPPASLWGMELDTSFRLYWLIVPIMVLMLLGAANLFRTRIGGLSSPFATAIFRPRCWASRCCNTSCCRLPCPRFTPGSPGAVGLTLSAWSRPRAFR